MQNYTQNFNLNSIVATKIRMKYYHYLIHVRCPSVSLISKADAFFILIPVPFAACFS